MDRAGPTGKFCLSPTGMIDQAISKLQDAMSTLAAPQAQGVDDTANLRDAGALARHAADLLAEALQVRVDDIATKKLAQGER